MLFYSGALAFPILSPWSLFRSKNLIPGSTQDFPCDKRGTNKHAVNEKFTEWDPHIFPIREKKSRRCIKCVDSYKSTTTSLTSQTCLKDGPFKAVNSHTHCFSLQFRTWYISYHGLFSSNNHRKTIIRLASGQDIIMTNWRVENRLRYLISKWPEQNNAQALAVRVSTWSHRSKQSLMSSATWGTLPEYNYDSPRNQVDRRRNYLTSGYSAHSVLSAGSPNLLCLITRVVLDLLKFQTPFRVASTPRRSAPSPLWDTVCSIMSDTESLI